MSESSTPWDVLSNSDLEHIASSIQQLAHSLHSTCRGESDLAQLNGSPANDWCLLMDHVGYLYYDGPILDFDPGLLEEGVGLLTGRILSSAGWIWRKGVIANDVHFAVRHHTNSQMVDCHPSGIKRRGLELCNKATGFDGYCYAILDHYGVTRPAE